VVTARPRSHGIVEYSKRSGNSFIYLGGSPDIMKLSGGSCDISKVVGGSLDICLFLTPFSNFVLQTASYRPQLTQEF
jgi:hypothetical protein